VSPLQWFVAAFCGWILREQDDVIAFLREENRVLRAQLRDDGCNSVMRNGGVWLSSDISWEVPRWRRWRPSPRLTPFSVGTAS
jgi:hypothetical protein